MPKFKKNTSRFRMKSPFRIDLTRKTGLGPRAMPNVEQGDDAFYEEQNDKCLAKGMVYSMEEGKCVKKGSMAKKYGKPAAPKFAGMGAIAANVAGRRPSGGPGGLGGPGGMLPF